MNCFFLIRTKFYNATVRKEFFVLTKWKILKTKIIKEAFSKPKKTSGNNYSRLFAMIENFIEASALLNYTSFRERGTESHLHAVM